MKIVFIQPHGSGHPPLGLAYLAAVLKSRNYNDVEIVDLRAPPSKQFPTRTWNHLDAILKQKPDIIGVTSTTAIFHEAVRICKHVREYCSTLMTGGSHATIFQEKILQDYPFIDVVVYGEADKTIVEIANRIEQERSLENVEGTIYREHGKIRKNKPAPLVTDLDSIPFPARHLLDLGSYHTPFAIITSRGCPYNCVYCSKPVFGRFWRGRTTKNVVDEIEFLLENHPREAKRVKRKITISDECFNVDIKRAKEICDEIIRRNLGITLECISGFHVGALDYELLKKMKEAGCRELWFGVESGNPQVLEKVKKGITMDMARNAIKLAKKAEIEVIGGHFIIGLPEETIETARNTIQFMKELKLNAAAFNQATPYPDTELWIWVKKNGHFLFDFEDTKNYEILDCSNPEPRFETSKFTAKERQKVYGEALNEADKLIRRRCLAPRNIMKFILSIRSYPDIVWGFQRLNTLLFKKDILRRWQPHPKEEVSVMD